MSAGGGGCLPKGCLTRECVHRGVVCPKDGCVPRGCLPRGVSATQTCGQTDVSENITLPQTSFEGGNYERKHHEKSGSSKGTDIYFKKMCETSRIIQ